MAIEVVLKKMKEEWRRKESMSVTRATKGMTVAIILNYLLVSRLMSSMTVMVATAEVVFMSIPL